MTDVVDEPVPLNMEPSMEVVGDILNQLSANQIQTIMNSVFDEMLGDVKVGNKVQMVTTYKDPGHFLFKSNICII